MLSLSLIATANGSRAPRRTERLLQASAAGWPCLRQASSRVSFRFAPRLSNPQPNVPWVPRSTPLAGRPPFSSALQANAVDLQGVLVEIEAVGAADLALQGVDAGAHELGHAAALGADQVVVALAGFAGLYFTA